MVTSHPVSHISALRPSSGVPNYKNILSVKHANIVVVIDGTFPYC